MICRSCTIFGTMIRPDLPLVTKMIRSSLDEDLICWRHCWSFSNVNKWLIDIWSCFCAWIVSFELSTEVSSHIKQYVSRFSCIFDDDETPLAIIHLYLCWEQFEYIYIFDEGDYFNRDDKTYVTMRIDEKEKTVLLVIEE